MFERLWLNTAKLRHWPKLHRAKRVMCAETAFPDFLNIVTDHHFRLFSEVENNRPRRRQMD
jgi:hypothetical protein